MREDNENVSAPSWRLIAFGASGLVLTIGGMAAGLWSSSLDKRLTDMADRQIEQGRILDSRADLAPRLAADERQTADLEARVRELEKLAWRARK